MLQSPFRVSVPLLVGGHQLEIAEVWQSLQVSGVSGHPSDEMREILTGTTELTASCEVERVSQGWLCLRSQLRVRALSTALPGEQGAVASSPGNPPRLRETV